MKFKIFLEYDGTRYYGWQIQKNLRTIQGTLINTIEHVFSKAKGRNELTDFQGSGRTDAGVHAYEQVAHLECITGLAPHILKIKINDELPADINILGINKAKDNFHSRHSAKARQYLYRISKKRSAFEKKYIWWIKDELDIQKMKESANVFTGYNDFKSFSDKSSKNESTIVCVESTEVIDAGDKILIRIKASHFLWKMVRRIVGVLVEAGRNNQNFKDLSYYLKNYSPEPAKYTAPPSGLFLEKVFY